MTVTDFIRETLFNHNILVSNHNCNELDIGVEVSATLYSLLRDFGISVTEGYENANRYVYSYVAEQLTHKATSNYFYEGFPSTVYKMSADELRIDQIVSYIRPYLLGDFSEQTKSIFEPKEITRIVLADSDVEVKKFRIIQENQVESEVKSLADSTFNSTRALTDTQLLFLKAVVDEYNYFPANIASKNTSIYMLVETRNMEFAKFIELPDVLKVVEHMQNIDVTGSHGRNLKDIHLPNSDRKFISNLIEYLFSRNPSSLTVVSCYERKKLWNGLLHCIHFHSNDERISNWVNSIRNNEKRSELSKFEYFISVGDIATAASILKRAHGDGAVIRNLNYLISRCLTNKQIEDVITNIGNDCNPIVLMQYANSLINSNSTTEPRTFSFVKNGLHRRHTETGTEVSHRKSILSDEKKNIALANIYAKLVMMLSNREKIGNVYIGNDVKKIALPLYSASGNSGFGVLPCGSRIPINGKSVRAFTYWENVNDIDLSVTGVSDDFSYSTDFYWGNIAHDNGEAITFSGDVTCGFFGGSEYFDINLDTFKNKYPNIRYLVFNDNVYSCSSFDQVFCKAGFMLRDDVTAGAVYEPKTVKTSFIIDCESRYARLFAIDLKTDEIIWLNVAVNSDSRVAAGDGARDIKKYLFSGNIFNYEFLFSNIGNVVDNIEDADIVVTDEDVDGDKTVIHSYDTEKVANYIVRS